MKKGASLKLQLDRERRKVDVDQFDVTLREIVRMCASNELKRAPAYQRKFRWDERDESRLIESFLLGLPIPNIFVATNDNGTWELVDGLQRVSTILHFIAKPSAVLKDIGKGAPLTLGHLTTLTSFNGRTFADLPMPIRLMLYKRSIRVTALSDKSDPNVRFDMFDRLNSGGIALTAQEIRACIYSGDFVEFLRKRAGNPRFLSLLKLPRAKQNDGTKEELVLKFFAYLNNRDRFTSSVKRFLNEYIELAVEQFDYPESEKLFDAVVEKLATLVGGAVLRQDSKVTPLNQLEALMVACAELIREGKEIATPPDGWLDDEQLRSFSSVGTNSRANLTGRINRAKELLSVTS